MTLVLPFGGDQIANNSLFSRSANNQNSSMPCVFDSEAFERDFESALIRDWTSGIGDYDIPAEDSPVKTPSESTELKRKAPTAESEESQESKKPRFDSYDIDPSVPSSSPSDEKHRSSPDTNSSSLFIESSQHLSSTTSSDETDASAAIEDDEYLPRRRGIQMWNSRQRWKDERKKVLKMSVTKLAEIDDPELCLLRSVLINNTIKKLHSDIRNERSAKIRQKVRHKLQRMDFFTERLLTMESSEASFTSTSDFHDEPKPNPVSSSDFYDENSCDEMFGISEDFLRCSIPDRRVSSPIPTTSSTSDSSNLNCSIVSPNVNCSNDSSSMECSDVSSSMNCSSDSSNPNLNCPSAMDCVTVTTTTNNVSVATCPSCDTAANCSSPFCHRQSSSNFVQTVISSTTAAPAFPTSHPMRRTTTSGSQCATQYRTNRDMVGGGMGDVSFPPRVPILDSVVYHSLLASLESA